MVAVSKVLILFKLRIMKNSYTVTKTKSIPIFLPNFESEPEGECVVWFFGQNPNTVKGSDK